MVDANGHALWPIGYNLFNNSFSGIVDDVFLRAYGKVAILDAFIQNVISPEDVDRRLHAPELRHHRTRGHHQRLGPSPSGMEPRSHDTAAGFAPPCPVGLQMHSDRSSCPRGPAGRDGFRSLDRCQPLDAR